jgi:hypothetical protein
MCTLFHRLPVDKSDPHLSDGTFQKGPLSQSPIIFFRSISNHPSLIHVTLTLVRLWLIPRKTHQPPCPQQAHPRNHTHTRAQFKYSLPAQRKIRSLRVLRQQFKYSSQKLNSTITNTLNEPALRPAHSRNISKSIIIAFELPDILAAGFLRPVLDMYGSTTQVPFPSRTDYIPR